MYNCDNSGISRDKCENVQLCVQPVEADLEEPVRSTEAPIKSTEAPIRSTEAPIRSTEAPIKATEEPVQSTEDASNLPSYKPVDSVNGHGKPVGSFTQEEISRPIITSPTVIDSGPGSKPTNRKLF